MAGTLVEVQMDPEEIVVDPIPSNEPLVKISPPGTPSGFIKGRPFEQRLDSNSAIQQSGPISRDRKTTGIAFSGGGIRSAAFCSGALRRMLQDDVPLEYLSCVSGGGFTGAAFLDWKQRPKRLGTTEKSWQREFFEKMRKNAGYMCNCQSPRWGILQSISFTLLLILVVIILPCVLWLPYAFPIAVVVDVLFGGILRENSTCPPSVSAGAKTSFLILELYDDCQAPGRRVALFLTTFAAWLVFFILSRIKYFIEYRNLFRFLSIISGQLFALTFFPWIAHDFLWPLKTWIKVLGFLAFLVLPFFLPIVRNVAAIFLFFYAYTLFVSWRVFKADLFGVLPYSDEVFYPILIGCAFAIILFPFIGSVHQSVFNIYYRYRLSEAFFEQPAKCRWQDVIPNCVRPVESIYDFISGKGFFRIRETDELTFDHLIPISPTFISNITVNDWQISSGAKSSHQLISFSPDGVELIGSDLEKPSELSRCFKPEHMRLSTAMAISGAAVSYDMGSYENGLDMALELLNLLGIGMGDEMISDQCRCQEHRKSTKGKIKQYVLPFLVEICCVLPLLASPFVYWVGHSKHWVEYLVLAHTVVVVLLTGLAMAKTGSTEPGRWERILSWWIRHTFFVRFIRGFLSVNNVGTHPPPVLRLSDGGHFENLALLPLLDKKLKKIVIFDGSCNPGDEKYAESLLIALELAREKLHCSFEGMSGRDINEDIRVEFLKMTSDRRPRSYRFKVQYYDKADNKGSQGEILFVAPRHPSESRPLKRAETEQPKPWGDFDTELESLDPTKWGESPELTVREADRLTFCCCHRCHCGNGSCQCISECFLGRFPHHITANQFFTPDTFSAYHREGYAACVEADVENFFKQQSTQDS